MNDKNHDNEMVKVNLDVQRMYRVNHEDKEAITVGPGEAMVPAWVAAHWEESSKPAASPTSLPTLPDNERADFQRKIANLLDEIAALKARLETKPGFPLGQDALPRGVPRHDPTVSRDALPPPPVAPPPSRPLPRPGPEGAPPPVAPRSKIENGGKKVN